MNGKKHIRIPVPLLLLTGLMWLFSGCGVYSFTGASIPPEAKTISVQYFPNKAQLVEPTLSAIFTDALRDQFTRQTNLEMVDRNGDLALEGEIVDYKTTPVAIQGDQTSALNRLTITVNVRFVNVYEPNKDFEKKFTQYLDYASDADYNAVKGELILGITEMLTTDIFNKAVINW
jgi:hypothetical protein